MRERTSKKRSIGNNRWALIALPIVFVLLAFGIAFFALKPVITPVLAVANMFMSPTAQEVNLPRNLLESVPPPPPPLEQDIPTVETIPLSGIILPAVGDQYAQITVEGTDIDAPVYWGDTDALLNAGIGTYAKGSKPGFGGTIMLAGHTGTWFYDMESVELGAIITVETHYGTYTYEVVDMAVKNHQDSSAYDFSREDENIILYTCYPFWSMDPTVGLKQDRYFVYGNLLEGPVIDMDA